MKPPWNLLSRQLPPRGEQPAGGDPADLPMPLDAEAGIEMEDTTFLYGPSGDGNDVQEQDDGMAPEVEFEGAMNVDSLVCALTLAGADAVSAKRFAYSAVKNKLTFVELFGRGSIVELANGPRRNLNVRGLAALDLRTTKPDGSVWDFTNPRDRKLAVQLVREREPTWIIGSPRALPSAASCLGTGPECALRNTRPSWKRASSK